PDAGAQALQARQPALSDRRAGTSGVGRQADRRAGAAELAPLPRQAAERPLEEPLPVREPRPEGRDRRLQLRGRRSCRRRWKECRYRLLAVGPCPPARTRAGLLPPRFAPLPPGG